MSNNEQQLKREREQRKSALKRLDNEHKKARKDCYATNSPYLRSRAYEFVEQYAIHIQKEVLRRTEKRERTGHFEALRMVVDRFAELEPMADETLTKPTLGFMLISRTIWARVMDNCFYTGNKLTEESSTTRSSLAAAIGEDLERTLKLRYYIQLSAKLEDQAMKEVTHHLLQMEMKYIDDPHGGLTQRRDRAKDFIAEWDSGHFEVEKGKHAGKWITIEPFSWASTGWDNPWGDQLRTMAASELLDMLVCPVDDSWNAADARPLYYQKIQEGKKTPYIVRIRPEFINELHGIRDQLSKYVIDWLPMVTPPRDWQHEPKPGTLNNTGGYESLQLRQLAPMIRFGQGANGSIPSKMATDFLNTIQKVAWEVNEDQLALVERISMEWEKNYDGIVRPTPWTREDLQNSTGAAVVLEEVQYRDAHKHEDPKSRTPEERIAWSMNNQLLSERYREVTVSRQRIAGTATMVGRLQSLKGSTLWYPWSYDSRFRCYPIGGVGTPQGRPAERYTLQFKEGQLLDNNGIEWALRGLGAAALDTKVSVQQRIEWAKENLDLIRQIGEGSDRAIEVAGKMAEPLNLLNLSRAWVQHEAGGQWHAPVFVDATNSGWQFVAALLNVSHGIAATNLRSGSYNEPPADAYRLALNTLLRWIKTRDMDKLSLWVTEVDGDEKSKRVKKNPPQDVLDIWEDVLTYKSLGRTLVKSVARTMIYGSSNRTWADDMETEFHEANVALPPDERGRFSRNRITATIRNGLASMIGHALSHELGSVLNYTKGIRSMAEKRLYQGCSDELIKSLHGFGKLSSTDQVEIGKRLLDESTHGISWKTPDGSVISVCEYVETIQRFTTLHHGKPSINVVHTDAMDPLETLKAVAPGIIHGLDATLLRCALAHVTDVPFTCIHDAVGGLPNDMDMISNKLRDAFLMATPSGYLKGIADQWEVPLLVDVGTDESWRNEVHNAVNMFN